ncbi:MAG: PIN domain-containing protein [Methylomonas sp.]|jgi:predicted nucleic acid-binding protein
MIIADTGFWVGLFDKSDSNHTVCKQFLSQCKEPLVTTAPVLTETVHLLNQRHYQKIALNFLALLIQLQNKQLFTIFEAGNTLLPRQFELMRQYEDLPMDFADASLVVLAEHLGHGRIVSTDKRDFGAYRWKNRQPFQNLLGI